MLLSGDLYKQETTFFHSVESGAPYTVEEWVQDLDCPVIRVDGTKPVEENIGLIIRNLRNYNSSILMDLSVNP